MGIAFNIFNQIFEFSPEDDEAYNHFKAFFTYKAREPNKTGPLF